MPKFWIAAAALAAVSLQAQAQSPAAKSELVARILELQRPGIETLARVLTEQPAMQLMQQAGPALQRVPADKREATARAIEADVRKYVEDATPIVRERALKLAPTTIGVLLGERFSEDELRQIVALLESPANRKYMSMAPDMQRSIGEKLVAETRGAVEPKARELEQAVRKHLAAADAGAAEAPKR